MEVSYNTGLVLDECDGGASLGDEHFWEGGGPRPQLLQAGARAQHQVPGWVEEAVHPNAYLASSDGGQHG